MLISLIALLLFQQPPKDPALGARIRDLLHTVLTTQDDKAEQSARATAKTILNEHGLVSIAEVGDDASYALIFLTCSPDVSAKATAAAARHEVPADAATMCAAH